jgi:glutamine amidotransferase
VIALIDYDSGNLRSVQKALLKAGGDVRIVRRPEEMTAAGAVVLPGVGAFDDCVNAMRKQDLLDAIREFIRSGRPFLGICVGYQALFERSEEFNSCAPGLGVFAGKVVRFTEEPGLKIPQIGWNRIDIARPDCPLYRGIDSGSYVYFVHSFFPQPTDPAIIATTTTYGRTFASSVWRDNVFATQFHPEKSQEVGLQLLRNFVGLAAVSGA